MARKNTTKNATKMCTRCHAIKQHDEFYRDKSQKDGFATWCKTCESEYNKMYFAALKKVGVTRKIDIVDDKTRAKFEREMRNARIVRGDHKNAPKNATRTNTRRATKKANA